MNILKKIINVIVTLIIVLGGVFLFLYFIGIVPYVVLSGSMEPTIQTGSICFVNKNIKFSNIKEKDIIAFKLNNGTLVTHRAIKIDNKEIKTKGDHNKKADEIPVSKNNYVGKNILSIPKIGYLIIAFQSPKGIIILITCIIILFASGILFGEDNKKIERKK